jgi:hypothetical protein
VLIKERQNRAKWLKRATKLFRCQTPQLDASTPELVPTVRVSVSRVPASRCQTPQLPNWRRTGEVLLEHIEDTSTFHVSEAEATRDFGALPRVRAGAEIIIERNACPVSEKGRTPTKR